MTKAVTILARAEGEGRDVNPNLRNQQDPLHQVILQLLLLSLASPKKSAEKEVDVVLPLEDGGKRQMGRMKRLTQTVPFLPLPKQWHLPAVQW